MRNFRRGIFYWRWSVSEVLFLINRLVIENMPNQYTSWTFKRGVPALLKHNLLPPAKVIITLNDDIFQYLFYLHCLRLQMELRQNKDLKHSQIMSYCLCVISMLEHTISICYSYAVNYITFIKAVISQWYTDQAEAFYTTLTSNASLILHRGI